MSTEYRPPRQPQTPDNEHEPSEGHWSWEDVRAKLIESATGIETGMCAFDELPKTIELGGTLLLRIQELAEHARTEKKERGFAILYEPDGKRLLLPKTHDVQTGKIQINDVDRDGVYIKKTFDLANKAIENLSNEEAEQLIQALNRMDLAKAQNKDLLFAGRDPESSIIRKFARHDVGTAHCHPSRLPFSKEDIILLLQRPFERFFPLTDSSNNHSLLVSTSETTYVESDEEAQMLMAKWEAQTDKRFAEIIATYTSSPVPQELVDAANERHNNIPELDTVQARVNREVERRVYRSHIKAIAKKYKFGYYEGNNGKLTRVE